MICTVCNKEFTKTHHNQKYCSKICSKKTTKENIKKYSQSDKAKAYQKEYKQTDKGKADRIKYFQSDKGKAAVKKYNQSDTKKEYEKSDKYREAKKIYLKKYAKTYQLSDKAKAYRSAYHKERRKSDPAFKLKYNTRMNAYRKKRIKYDPIFKLIVNARTRLNIVLKNKNIKKMNSTIELFGCTPKFLKEYLEKQFYPHPITNKPMTWKNHTLRGWHVDHIDPLDLAMIPEDIVVLAHYSNLQPMWATENIKKGNKILPD